MSLKFLKLVRKLRGSSYLIRESLGSVNQLTKKNCLHYVAFSCNYYLLQYLVSKINTAFVISYNQREANLFLAGTFGQKLLNSLLLFQ